MSRSLDAFVVVDDYPRRVYLRGFSGYSDQDGLFRVNGCGFNAADHLCRLIGRFIHGDGTYFRYEWF